MDTDEIIATIVYNWHMDRDGDGLLEQIATLWTELVSRVDYYTALAMIEEKMSVTDYMDLCEVLNI